MIKYSLIVPTYNRKGYLGQLLESIDSCDAIFDCLEVVIINDGSNDGTDDFLNEFNSKNLRYSFKYYNLINQGPAFARNYGAKMAIGEWLIFVDDDCLLSKNYFNSSIEIIRSQPNIVALAGHIIALSNTLISRYIDWSGIMLSPFVDKHNKAYFVTANAWIRRDVFLDMGGFDMSFTNASGEDVFLSRQIRSAGYSIYYNNNMIVRHRHRDSLVGLFKTCELYGKGHHQIDLLYNTVIELSYFKNIISSATTSIIKILRSNTILYGLPFFFLDLIRSVAWTYGYKKAINKTNR